MPRRVEGAMKVNAPGLVTVAGVGLMLLAAGLPLSNVAAHSCYSLFRQHPQDPNNADTGCDGTSCPSRSGTKPHHHVNDVPPAECRTGRGNYATSQMAAGGGQGGPFCPHGSPHSHTYGNGGEASDAGSVIVADTNTFDCDGNGIPGDFDGDYESGVGGGFFGYGAWANEPTCSYGLATHGGSVTVHDAVFGEDVWFVVGASDTSGPIIVVDPATGSTFCSTDGVIAPGDPATDPTADADDCVEEFHGSGTTCGAGGDGGYWVILSLDGNPPSVGTITA